MKRLFDFSVSFIAVLTLLPIFFLLAFLVRINIGSPIFFTQNRTGLHGKAFTIIKFASMTNARSAQTARFCLTQNA